MSREGSKPPTPAAHAALQPIPGFFAPPYRLAVPRYRLTIAYDGTDFCGWQKQEPKHPDLGGLEVPEAKLDASLSPTKEGRIALRTVQAVVERAVREVVREPVVLTGASRTDAGVHARAQCAAFTSTVDASQGRGWPADRGTEPLIRAINSRLPEDVLITDAQLTDDDFEPIAGAKSKGYSYTMISSPHRPLWDRRTVYHTWHELDAARMHEAAQRLIGEHDFASMAALGHGRQTTVRTIHDCAVRAGTIDAPRGSFASQRITIDVSGNGFLWNMVRILAGTLHEVGRGRLEPADIPRILESKDRTNAGPTLPPEGLCLEWIRYA